MRQKEHKNVNEIETKNTKIATKKQNKSNNKHHNHSTAKNFWLYPD